MLAEALGAYGALVIISSSDAEGGSFITGQNRMIDGGTSISDRN